MKLFEIIKSNMDVTALIGEEPVRFFPWGAAPQGVALPYAVYGVISATPENYVGTNPDIDTNSYQIDIYAKTGASCEEVFAAIRGAVQEQGYVINFQKQVLDPETRLYTSRIDLDMIEDVA